MRLRFTKMHGLGNDFIMLDGVSQKLNITPGMVRKLADRHFGIGCDQLLVVESPQLPEADFRYRIYNADGGEVENCGNGARCFAVFVKNRGLTFKDEIVVESGAGLMTLSIRDDKQVTVNMGVPVFEPARVPFVADADAITHELELPSRTLEISTLAIGNPHAVTYVENLHDYPVLELGPQVETHERFPNRVNAGFAQRISDNEVRVRVFERGVGETIACGTGACAAVIAGVRRGLLKGSVNTHLSGGTLEISWAGEGQPVMMTGPAKTVFHGQINI